ncbi:hypothetical protein AOQ84DRAFT_391892 [Glonium stellatum]|uniref:Uncharacterized protein n=1 Tax=Glonium stellatum TaxID=574774 RepID=A0A8E2JNM9_9PEZI|nr:hypothetical protein AOQ84DRAFT_391892 [Glonium stellatum]
MPSPKPVYSPKFETKEKECACSHHDFPVFLPEEEELLEENAQLHRQVGVLERKYCVVKDQLKAAWGTLGFYENPFPFLALPREIRDQIYLYGLTAPQPINPSPNILEEDPYVPTKPGCPELCLASKQVYYEANAILYAKTTFVFQDSEDMVDFFDRIGRRNTALIQSISIAINFTPMVDGRAQPSDWVNALSKSGLRRVCKMRITGERVGAGEFEHMRIDSDLAYTIKDIFGRDREVKPRLSLTLKGFRKNEHKKFPDHWKIVMEQWYEANEASNRREEWEDWCESEDGSCGDSDGGASSIWDGSDSDWL